MLKLCGKCRLYELLSESFVYAVFKVHKKPRIPIGRSEDARPLRLGKYWN